MTTPASEVTFGFGVTPHDVSVVASQCQNTAEEIAGQLAVLKSYVEDLETQWLGIAAGTFSALMTDWNIYASMLHQALTEIGQGLATNHLNYTNNEEVNISGLKTVNGALPGAPGASLASSDVIS